MGKKFLQTLMTIAIITGICGANQAFAKNVDCHRDCRENVPNIVECLCYEYCTTSPKGSSCTSCQQQYSHLRDACMGCCDGHAASCKAYCPYNHAGCPPCSPNKHCHAIDRCPPLPHSPTKRSSK